MVLLELAFSRTRLSFPALCGNTKRHSISVGLSILIDAQLLAMIKALPKIELHRHLEGSVRLSTLSDIAREYNLAVPNYEPETIRPFVQITPNDPLTVEAFLSKFYVLRQFYCSTDIIRRIVRESVEDAALDNVRYMELRFTPLALGLATDTPISEVVPLVCETAHQAAKDFDVQVGLIVSMNRHEPLELGEEALAAALINRDKGVVGVDLAGDESRFAASPFYDLFQQARDAELGITVHAGEWAGADSVWDAVGNLGATRVGHGVRLLEDPAMVEVIRQRGTVLEVCPTSNYFSGVVESLAAHPLIALNESGVLTTINTDDPTICDVTLSDEIAISMHHMHLSLDAVKQSTLCAARAAFLPPVERDALVQRFEAWWADH